MPPTHEKTFQGAPLGSRASNFERAIGGYFELELPASSSPRHPQARHYQSARAGFLALLRHVTNVRRVWMPTYICDAMLAPVRAAGKEICFYSLDQRLAVSDHVTLGPDDLLLYVNYFGVCTAQVDALLERFSPDQVVLDLSQAFYAEPRHSLAALYSPRKFFGVPDGGLLVTDLPISPPAVQDNGSENRVRHLVKRLGSEPELGYEDFRRAEESLDDMEPKILSVLSERLLGSVDHEAARQSRNRNFQYLRRALDITNTFSLPSSVDGPMCYPYMPRQAISRDKLVKSRIFIPTYWPEVLARVTEDEFESKFVKRCLPIPCDQRYTEDSLDRILNVI